MKNIRILIRNGIGMHPLKKAEKVNAINKRYQYEDIRKDKRCYKFVAKTHRLAYGMKATYTFYLSFT